MINNELKEKIIPNLKIHLQRNDWKYVEMMFSEVYYTYFEGLGRVTLMPHPNAGDIAMQFSSLTGSFIEITSWDYIKTVGKKL